MKINKLHLTLSYINNPYEKMEGSENELWARISFNITIDEKTKEIVSTQWDAIPFIQWFIENYYFIKNEPLFIPDKSFISKGRNIAKQIWFYKEREFNKNEDNEEYKWFSYLDTYYQRHNVREGLSGSKFPNIFLGRVKNLGNISKNGPKKWSYYFNMDMFLNETKLKIIDFIGNTGFEQSTGINEKLFSKMKYELQNLE